VKIHLRVKYCKCDILKIMRKLFGKQHRSYTKVEAGYNA